MSRFAQREGAIAAALRAARTRSQLGAFIGHAELYCENGDCVAREVDIRFKEHDDQLPSRLICPACQAPLTLHGVQTLEERDEAEEAAARRSVNEQLWRRAHPDAFGVPIGVSLDDTLPGVRA